MAKTVSMAGIYPIPTPYDAPGELNLKALANNLAQWSTHPLAGYVVLGTNGEMSYLSEAGGGPTSRRSGSTSQQGSASWRAAAVSPPIAPSPW